MSVNDEGDQLIIIMGVAGSGKSTIATLLSQILNWPMIEGDDFHPEENVKKMSSGQPLSNADRMPWLDSIANEVNNHMSGPLLLACSALNHAIRERLIKGVNRPCRWILLDVPEPILAERLAKRADHFMGAALLASQLEALEIPLDSIRINAISSPEMICEDILDALRDTP